MKTKIGQREKTMIAVILAILILAGGGRFIVYPNYTYIKSMNSKITEENSKIVTARQAIVDEREVTKEFKDTVVKVKRAEKNFYREMSETETVDTVQGILEAGGFFQNITSGITVSGVGSVDLSVNPYDPQKNINYEIRQYTFLTKLEDEGQIEGEVSAETGEKVVSMEDALKMLRSGWMSDADFYALPEAEQAARTEDLKVASEQREFFKQVVRNNLAGQQTQVGLITANFSMKMTYPRYLEFLRYINHLQRATSVVTDYGLNPKPVDNEYNDYSFTMNLLVVKEMEIPVAFGDDTEISEIANQAESDIDKEIEEADAKIASEVAKNSEAAAETEVTVLTSETNLQEISENLSENPEDVVPAE